MGGAIVCLDPWRYGLSHLKIILQIQLFATIFRVYLGISLRNSSDKSLPVTLEGILPCIIK